MNDTRTVSVDMLKSVIRDIRDDAASMRKVNPDGRVHGFASRFEAYAGALEGFVKPVNNPGEQVLDGVLKDEEMGRDEDIVPVAP